VTKPHTITHTGFFAGCSRPTTKTSARHSGTACRRAPGNPHSSVVATSPQGRCGARPRSRPPGTRASERRQVMDAAVAAVLPHP
jgi:hypothetical protein